MSQRRAAGAGELPPTVERAAADAPHAAGGVSRLGRTSPNMDRLRRGLLAGDHALRTCLRHALRLCLAGLCQALLRTLLCC